MGDDGAKRQWPVTFGSSVSPADIVRTFWSHARVKHDPKDLLSKDWANSEPDPNAP